MEITRSEKERAMFECHVTSISLGINPLYASYIMYTDQKQQARCIPPYRMPATNAPGACPKKFHCQTRNAFAQ
jgi:hypothetical protein